MGIFLTIGLLAVLIVIAYEVRRSARVRYLEQAERLRIRFSRLRHRLVMLAGSGQMSGDDRKAFEFLYHATTRLLRYPTLYKQLSTSTCVASMDGIPSTPPTIRKDDFSHRTHPLLEEYVEASGQLVQEFPPPALVLAAILSWKRVLEWSRDAGRWLKELEAERERVKAWRRVSLTLL
ncbi:MAG: hypothetical protein ACREVY_11100 [Gammaproteobacteria bacterium]